VHNDYASIPPGPPHRVTVIRQKLHFRSWLGNRKEGHHDAIFHKANVQPSVSGVICLSTDHGSSTT